MSNRPAAGKRALVTVALLTAGALGLSAPPAQAQAAPQVITLEMSECNVMAIGTTGTCVYSLQNWLNIFDQAGLVTDSRFGPATDQAVRIFQNRHGLVADGQFGTDSRNALRGVFQEMSANSVATPQPIADTSVATPVPSPKDPGPVETGIKNEYVTIVGCAAVSGVVSFLATPLAGVGAGTFCEVVLS